MFGKACSELRRFSPATLGLGYLIKPPFRPHPPGDHLSMHNILHIDSSRANFSLFGPEFEASIDNQQPLTDAGLC